ncbi:MAG: thioredoxin domain-containing protein, partial [Acidimicrobiales bacterium]
MAAGGMYDHLVGGFCRYSTDNRWLVHHFEKMLTDQALLARAYLHAWQLAGRANDRQVLEETVEAMLRDLAAPSGGLCSSVDADAGGREGSHATFTPDQVALALAAVGLAEHTEAACAFYGVTEPGNWEGTTVLRRPLGADLGRSAAMEAARGALLEARRGRPQPGIDDKVLTEWNAMAVSALAEAAAATGSTRWRDAAVGIAETLFTRLRRPDGRWLRSLQGDDARHLALAADYAWVLDAATRLGELTGLAVWTERALDTARDLLRLFAPVGGGPLFTTGEDADPLIVRPTDLLDGALPSANAVAVSALLRLGALTGEAWLTEAADRIVASVAGLVESNPVAFADLVAATSLLDGPTEIVVTGERPDLLSVARARWLPDAVLAWGEPTDSPLWAGRADGAAYVCRHYACLIPATDPATLATQLANHPGG